MKLILLALCTFIGSSASYLYHDLSHCPAKFLIPKGYTGDIYVIYGQPNGSPEECDGNGRVYRIPSNGILFTRFEPEIYTDDQQYYYCSAGKMKRIAQLSSGDFNEPWSYIRNPKEPSRDTIAIIDGGVMWTAMSAKSKYEYQHAFVGRYNQFAEYRGYRFSDIESLQTIADSNAH